MTVQFVAFMGRIVAKAEEDLFSVYSREKLAVLDQIFEEIRNSFFMQAAWA